MALPARGKVGRQAHRNEMHACWLTNTQQTNHTPPPPQALSTPARSTTTTAGGSGHNRSGFLAAIALEQLLPGRSRWVPAVLRCGTPQYGISSKKMALITSDYDTVCSLRIKWPVSPLEQLRPSFRPRVHNRPARVEHPMLCHPMPEGRTTRGDTGHLMRREHTIP